MPPQPTKKKLGLSQLHFFQQVTHFVLDEGQDEIGRFATPSPPTC